MFPERLRLDRGDPDLAFRGLSVPEIDVDDPAAAAEGDGGLRDVRERVTGPRRRQDHEDTGGLERAADHGLAHGSAEVFHRPCEAKRASRLSYESARP
jgi:hypothetical protein